MYVAVCDGLAVSEPESDFAPPQPFRAKQLVALEELHERIVDAPWVMDVGFATRITVGAPELFCTVIVVLSDVCCPELFWQVMVYVVVWNGDTDCDPDNDFVPDHPFDAEQFVALEELHERIEELPCWIMDGLAMIETIGIWVCWDTLTSVLSFADPALFVQVMV